MSDLFNHTDPFIEFWKVYPRAGKSNGRPGKALAKKRFDALIKSIDASVIIEAAKRYAAEREGEDPEFTMHASTWLNRRMFEDEAPAVTATRAAPETPDEWRQVLSNGDKPVYKSWYRQYCQNHWPNGGKIGPNPWIEFNQYIPEEIYNEYGGIWLWK